MATITIKELQFSSNTTHTFDAGNTYIITQYTAGTWDGADTSNRVKLRSGTPGTQVTLQVPAGISVSNMDFRDIVFTSNNITADSSCVGQLANNSGITWSSPAYNVWSAAGDSSWSVDASWSLGHYPTASEIATFNATSTQVCTVDMDVTCLGIMVEATYTTNLSFATRNISVSDGLFFSGTGTLNTGASWTITGDGATVTIASTNGALTSSQTLVTCSGVGVIWNNNYGGQFSSLTISDNKSIVIGGATQTWASATTTVIIGAGSTLTVNVTHNVSPYGNQAVFSLGAGYVINGSGQINVAGSTGSLALTIPAMDYTGTGTIAISVATTSTVTFSDAFSSTGNVTFTQGAITLSSSFTFSGASSTFQVSSTVGTFTATSCDVYFNGTTACRLIDNKAATFKSLTLGAGAYLTPSGSGTTKFISDGVPLTFTNGGTFASTHGVYFYRSTSGDLFSITGSPTISVTGGWNLGFIPSQNSLTLNIPAITITLNASCGILFYDALVGPTTFNMAGNITILGATSSTLQIYSNGALRNVTFNTNDYSISTLGVINFGSGNTGVFTLNAGASIFSIGSFRSDQYNVGSVLLNFSTSQWTCAGNWTFGTVTTFDASSSTVTFSANSTLTSAGKSFNNIIVSAGTTSAVDQVSILANGSLTSNATFSFNPTTSITVLSFAGAYTLNGTGAFAIGGTSASLTITLPAFTHTGSGTWTVNPAATSTTVFSGAVSIAGNLTLTGGAVTLSSTLTFTGASSVFTIGSGVGTFTGTACDILFNGTTSCSFTDNKSITLKSITLGASAVVTVNGAQNSTFQTTGNILTFISGGRLTLTRSIVLQITTANPFYSITGSPTIDGVGTLYLWVVAGGITATMPVLTTSGTVSVNVRNSSATGSSVTQTGNITLAGELVIRNSGANTFVFNTGDFSFTATNLYLGCDNAGGSFTFNGGNSSISISAFIGSTYNTGISNINFSSSQWTCTGAWTYGSSHTVDPGTSLVTLTGSSAQSISPADKSFYDFTVNKTAGTVSYLGTNINVHNFTTTATCAGSQDWSSRILIASGDISLGGTTSFNAGVGMTLTGASSILTIASSIATFTGTACVLTFNGTTSCQFTDNKGVSFKNLTLGTSAVLLKGGSALTIFGTTTANVFVMGDNSTFTGNTATLFGMYTFGQFFTIGSGCTWNGSGITYCLGGASGTLTFPAITYTGSGDWYIYTTSASVDNIFSFTGTVNIGTAVLRMYRSAATNTSTFNTNDNEIVCGTLYIGGGNATGTATFNFGSSSISISSFVGTSYVTGTINVNLQTSSWTCSGNWSFSSAHTVDPGFSLVTFTGTAATITPNGELFYDISTSTTTLSINSAITVECHNFTITAGRLNAGGALIIVSGDFLVNGGASHIFPNTLTMNGASSQLYIVNTTTVTATSCVLTFNGTTGCTLTDNKSVTFKGLVLGASAVLTSSGTTTFRGSTTLLTLGASSTFVANNSVLTFVADANMTVFSFGAGYTFSGSGAIYISNGGGVTVTIPEWTYTGTSDNIRFNSYDTVSSYIVSLSGAVNLGTNALRVVNTNASPYTLTLNSNGYAMTCGILRCGSSSTGNTTSNWGASVCSVSSFSGSGFNNATAVQADNFQTSQWTCAGNWTYGSNHTIDIGTTFSITFTGISIVTSNGKNLPTVTFNNNFSIVGACTLKELIWGVNGKTGTFDAGSVYTITNLSISDWDGSIGNLNALRSSIPGTQFFLNIPSPIILQYMNPQDSVVNNAIQVKDRTSLNSGNNVNWFFPVTSQMFWM